MKAFSIRQPWASLIASGKKTIETRVWATGHRGPLLICSSGRFADDFGQPPPEDAHLFPLGVTMCIVDVIDCRPMTRADEKAAGCEVYPRAYSWVLKNARKVHPVPVRGALKFFDVPDHLVRKI